MEFEQELCQAELAALPGPSRAGFALSAAPPPRPPRPRGAAAPAVSSPAETLGWVQNLRRCGAFRAQRPRPTLRGPRRVAAGCPRRGPSRSRPLGLFVGRRLCSRPGARRALRFPGRGREEGVAEAAKGCRPSRPLAPGFCFVLKPGVGEGQHLVNEKFPVRKTPLAEFQSCP